MSTNKIALFEIQYVYLYLYLLMPGKLLTKQIWVCPPHWTNNFWRSSIMYYVPLLCMTAVEVDNIPKMHVWKRKKRKQICDTHATFFIYMDAFCLSVNFLRVGDL